MTFIHEEIVESQLSSKSIKQLERMIGDAAFLTYPLHFLAGMLQLLLVAIALIGVIIFGLFVWLFNSHDNRAELTKNFASEQAVYRVDLGQGTRVMQSGPEFNPDNVAKAFGTCSDGVLKHPTWSDDSWLAEKSDAFELAYISASRNLTALRYTLDTVRLGLPVYSLSYLCGSTPLHPVVIPDAPVVEMSYLDITDDEIENPATYRGHWFTGMCLAGHCAKEDFVPRNTSIFYDAVAPEMTDGQEAALKALYATGTPEFWIAAAHANGIYGKDSEIASYAAMEQAQLANDLRHKETPSEEFAHMVAYAIGICFLLLLAVGVYIYRSIEPPPPLPPDPFGMQRCSCCGEIFHMKKQPRLCEKCIAVADPAPVAQA